MNLLLDQYQAQGEDLTSYLAHAKKVDEATIVTTFDTDEVMVYHVTEVGKEHLVMLEIAAGKWSSITDITKGIRPKKVSNRRYQQQLELLSEIKVNPTIFLLEGEDRSYFLNTSQWMYKTYSGRQKEIGGRALKSNDIKRDIMLSMQMDLRPFVSQAILRKEEECFKLFALHGKNYKRLALSSMAQYFSCFKPQKIHWTYTHERCQLYGEVKEQGDYVLGILLETSDTAYCSPRIYATIRRKNSERIYQGVNSDSIIKEEITFSEEQIETMIEAGTTFLEKMKRLKEEPVVYQETDFRKAILKKMKQISFAKFIGIKKSDEWKKRFKKPYFEEKEYTAEDVYEFLETFQEGQLTANQEKELKQLFYALYKTA